MRNFLEECIKHCTKPDEEFGKIVKALLVTEYPRKELIHFIQKYRDRKKVPDRFKHLQRKESGWGIHALRKEPLNNLYDLLKYLDNAKREKSLH